QGGATVAFKVSTFRVNQDRYAGFPGRRNQALSVGQGTFAVIRQNDNAGLLQLLGVILIQAAHVGGVEGFFEVQPDQLLVAAGYAQLGNGGQLRMLQEMTADPGLLQQVI